MKAIKNALIILTLAVTFSLASTSCSGAKNKAVEVIVEETNKQLPLQVDSETKLDKVTADGNSIVYHYTISDQVKEPIKGNIEAMKTSVVAVVKANPQFAPIRALGTSFKHVYHDNEGKEVVNFIITEEDYK